MAITIRAIAAKAKCHHTTVSRALRGHPGIPAETREHILRIAERMGYRPNPVVSAWMSHRRAANQPAPSLKICFVVRLRDRKRWTEAPSFTRYYAGAEQRAHALGFQFEEFWLGSPGMTQARMNRILLARGVDGLIIGSSTMPRSSLRLSWEKFAAVAQGFSLARPALSLTANNYAHTIELALRELRHLGYRRIGFFITPVVAARWSPFGPGAFLVYQEQLPARDRVPPFTGDVRNKTQFQHWVRENSPQVILTIHLAVESWLTDMGMRIPEDIGVAYADWNATDTGHAAGVDHQLEAAGAAAVDSIAANLQTNERGIPAVPKAILIPGSWVPGDTVRKIGPPAQLVRSSRLLSLQHHL
jgi:LacI family transcriptional regulator